MARVGLDGFDDRPSHLLSGGEKQLLAVASVLVTLLLVRGPLSAVLSYGRITGRDIADVGFVIAAGICSIGAVAALIASVAEFRAEHAWSHSHLPGPPG